MRRTNNQSSRRNSRNVGKKATSARLARTGGLRSAASWAVEQLESRRLLSAGLHASYFFAPPPDGLYGADFPSEQPIPPDHESAFTRTDVAGPSTGTVLPN